ncbi:nucleotide exchange factor GrpE [Reinekea blandensis]|uniref:Protein GrpE n=1 Tax=Reinekea blandensis MED297 TaxID=314283 RepID=A4BK72_9GAMM|nr:nucleotide exchange factor GrpE [Reinekea blandensis]EAR07501.1 co-chaperone GrpE [Reinekea sp. MED297] [Reinekea blandensis MED297]
MTGEEKPVEEILENASDEFDASEARDEANASETDVEALKVQLEQAQDEAAKMKDQYVRAEAEMANLRRRVEKDVENAHKFGQEKLTKELLAVADNLERAIVSTEGENVDVNAIKEGVEMTLKGLQDVFSKFSIEAIDPQGEPFDPQLHQAMSMVENPEVEPNTVIAVMQKGYQLHGRLVRPAMVMVSKGGAPAAKIDETA